VGRVPGVGEAELGGQFYGISFGRNQFRSQSRVTTAAL
jgi:hypothetical protein